MVHSDFKDQRLPKQSFATATHVGAQIFGRHLEMSGDDV